MDTNSKGEEWTLEKSRMKKCDVAPGIWEDENGDPHFDIPALLQLFELEDHAENREIASRNLRDMLRERMPKAAIICTGSPLTEKPGDLTGGNGENGGEQPK